MRPFFFFLTFLSVLFPEQKVVLISGSTGGIGIAAAKAFQADGWKVWAGYRRHIPDAFKGQPDIFPIHLDVADDSAVRACVERILQEDGRIDALVNNAGYGIIGADECVRIEEAKKLFEVNFFGALRLIHAALPAMRSRESGHIINISSTSGVRAVPGLGMYAATKFALEAISESMAATFSPWNIKVSLVEPGTVRNEWAKHSCISKDCDDQSLNTKLARALAKKLASLAERGQSVEEIGELIVQIANTKKPDMRYQTSPQVQDTLSKKITDLTGNALRDEQIRFFQSLVE